MSRNIFSIPKSNSKLELVLSEANNPISAQIESIETIQIDEKEKSFTGKEKSSSSKHGTKKRFVFRRKINKDGFEDAVQNTENNINNSKSETTLDELRSKASSQIDLEFPEIEIEFTECSNFKIREKRLIALVVLIFSTFFFTSLKYYISNHFKIATFCDIQDWCNFSNNVTNNIITLVEPVDCLEKCQSLSSIAFTKFFGLTFVLFDCFAARFCLLYVLRNKVKNWIAHVVTYAPIPCHLIGHLMFWNSKFMAVFVGRLLFVSTLFTVRIQSSLHFKVYIVIQLYCLYFSTVKLFFDMIFPFFIESAKEIALQCIPLIIYIIKTLALTIMKFSYFKRYTHSCKILVTAFFISFEFIQLATLHTIINRLGFYSQAMWTNIFQNVFLEIATSLLLKEKTFNFILKTFNKKEKPIVIDYKNIYIGLKNEFEVLSIFVYFLLIATKYYDYCQIPIVDCMGRPIPIISPIKDEHFYLCLVLLSLNLVQEIICFGLEKFLNLKRYFANTDLKNLYEFIDYILMVICILNDFGISMFYSLSIY